MSLREKLEEAGLRLSLSAGDVVTVKDKEIRFPLNLFRKPHVRRFAIVLSNAQLCAKYDVVSIAPTTASDDFKSEADIEFPTSPTNGFAKDSRVSLDQIMPIDRKWILQKVGRLSDAEWNALMTQLFWNYLRTDDKK